MGGKMAENSAAWENNNNSEVQAQPVYRETAKIKVIGIGGGGGMAIIALILMYSTCCCCSNLLDL